MRSGSAAESTPAPESDPARSDPAPEPGMPPDARHSGESDDAPAADIPPDPEAAFASNTASENTAPDAETPESGPAAPAPESSPEPNTNPESVALSDSDSATAVETSAAESSTAPNTVPADSATRPKGKAATPSAGLTGGIGCAALLLPLIAVAGAVLCFAAGVLSTASGCSPNGSALCSSNGAWYAFALPVFVSPLVAAATAIGAVTVHRHRSTWLAVGYGIVFISIIIGLSSASTGQ